MLTYPTNNNNLFPLLFFSSIRLVQTAESGEHALQIFATTTPVTPGQPPFDVIIVDQNMSSAGGAMLGHQVMKEG